MALFLVLLSFLFLFGSAFLFLHRQFTRRKLNLPPGTLGLPFVGETLQFMSAYKSENPDPFIDERVARYGAIFTTHVLGEPTIFSTDPEVNRFILKNEGKLFKSSYSTSISNLFGKHSILLARGAIHKRLHSLSMSFVNSVIIRDNLFVHIDSLLIQFNLDSCSDHIFLQDEAKKITFALAVKVLMSLDPGEWTENLRKEYILLIQGFLSLPVNFSFTTYGQAINAGEKVVDALKCVVQERRKEFEEGMSNAKKDVLDGLLVEGEGGFSDEQIVDFLHGLLFGAYETSAITMTLAVKFLTETPLALAQLKVPPLQKNSPLIAVQKRYGRIP